MRISALPMQFLSTLSLRRATFVPVNVAVVPTISIHALLAESDYTMTTLICIALRFLSTLSLRRATTRPCPSRGRNRNFYPRSPCGERHPDAGSIQGPGDFYPRSPCGERRWSVDVPGWILGISIHALLAESDTPRLSRVVPTPIFLSTLSLRRATIPHRGQTP